MTTLKQRVALVTGANKGIGFAIARKLGTLKMTILLGARDERRGKAAVETLVKEGIDAHFLQLDVTDSPSIEKARKEIDDIYGKLDILINNAGVALEQLRKSPSETSPDVVRKTFETNVFGVMAVTNAMLPLIRKAPEGRIVNLSSTMGSLSMWSDPQSPMRYAPVLVGYNTSKAALNALTVMYARELSGTSIKINAVSPGYISTDLNGHQGTGTVEEGAEVPVRLALLAGDGPTGGFFGENVSPLPW